MPSGSDQSHSSSSKGSDAEEGHPLDEVLSRRAAAGNPGSHAKPQAAGNASVGAGRKREAEPSLKPPPGLRRQREPEPPPAAATKPRLAAGSKRSQTPESGEVGDGAYSLEDDIIEAAISSGSEGSGYISGSGTDSEGGDDDGPAGKKAARMPLAAPHGVIVLQEGEENPRNAEVRRLLRMPRYFDPDYEEGGFRCFKCGGKGHMARDCTNQAKERPCFLCAQLGHESRDCPHSLCFRCQRPGHVARDCPYGYKAASWEEAGSPMCLRCGLQDCPCAGQRDYVRAEGGCRSDYSRSDLRHVRCSDCGMRGHLSCAPAPTQPAKLSCYNCGEGGHAADECWKETPQVISRERAGAGRSSYASSQQRSGGGGQPTSSGYAGGYGSGGYSGGRSQQPARQQQQQQYSYQQQQYDYGGGSRYGGQQAMYGSSRQGGRFASYHYASEIDQRYSQQQQAPYIDDSYGDYSRGVYGRGGRR